MATTAAATYDALRRPASLFVLGTDPVNSDPRTLAGEICYETTVYGEGQPNDQALNLGPASSSIGTRPA